MDEGFQFNAISTFSGCGGSSFGYKLAGGKILLAVDYDADAVATYRANFPATPVHHGDIVQLGVDECCRLAQVRPGELDLLDGSPPCQGYSTLGDRDFADPRNQLFAEFVRLLRGLQPKTFVMENVGGMVKGKMKLIFADCLRELKASGYRVKARLLNAVYFNVPQVRKRIIFIGAGRSRYRTEPSEGRERATKRATGSRAARRRRNEKQQPVPFSRSLAQPRRALHDPYPAPAGADAGRATTRTDRRRMCRHQRLPCRLALGELGVSTHCQCGPATVRKSDRRARPGQDPWER